VVRRMSLKEAVDNFKAETRHSPRETEKSDDMGL
jgi:hypothetical protein